MAKRNDYSKKLKHPAWQRKRLEILQRDDFTCAFCRDKDNRTLHVHHKKYEYGNDPWDYPNENFITLCELCHRLFEDHKKVSGSEIFHIYIKQSTLESKTIQAIVFLTRPDNENFISLYQIDDDGDPVPGFFYFNEYELHYFAFMFQQKKDLPEAEFYKWLNKNRTI